MEKKSKKTDKKQEQHFWHCSCFMYGLVVNQLVILIVPAVKLSDFLANLL